MAEFVGTPILEDEEAGDVVIMPSEQESEVVSSEEIREVIQQMVQDQAQYDNCANLTLPDPSIVSYYRSQARRILWFEDEIDDNAIVYANHIISWNIEDIGIPVEERTPIKIYINSPGGNLNECMVICDAIRMSETPVYTINMNSASSAAAAIFLCGHKRIAFPSASFLIHLGSGGTYGTYQQTKSQQKNYDKTIEIFKKIIKEQMQLSEDLAEKFDELIDGEWYLYMTDTDPESDHNARKYNLVTEEMNFLSQFNTKKFAKSLDF